MNKEELKQKAIDFEKNWFDEDIVISDLLIEFATEVTKELEAQIEKMKQCGNCGNGTIGNCEYCKRKPNQTRTDTSDYWKLKEIKENG